MLHKIRKVFLYITSVMPAMLYAASETPQQVLETIDRVNTYWQANNSPEVSSFWDNAAYHTGNMEAYFLTGNEDYRQYSEAWAEYNQWKGAKSGNRSQWKYSYGESDEYVLFGDYQVCFQTYADLYTLEPADYKIARAREVMEYQMSTPQNDYWWWADGLYMVMPVMTKMYNLTHNPLYLEKLHEYWDYANQIMYDEDAKLYYRDGKYVYPKHKSVNGKKDFWARGDGWVFAALAKVLSELPHDDKYRTEYEQRFMDMAQAIIDCQQPGGYWTRSMLDPEHAPGPETSGTAFFAYGLFWGINHGCLQKATYLEPAMRAWNYLHTVALQPDGRVGYVQPIGEKAIPGQVVDANSAANFGVGAFLLAASEYARFLGAENTVKRKQLTLVWSDEFERDGCLDNSFWNYENGFKRNNEDQWYQPENAICENGRLVITARAEHKKKNPDYDKKSRDWRKNRKYIACTSASVTTAGKKEFMYGRFEVRARIPVAGGAWPAIWTLGREMQWPSCGEIDIMEYYAINGVPHILANAAWGNDQPYRAVWATEKIPFTHFTDKDADWAEKFHVWRMDWDEKSIRLYLDDELLNEIPLKKTVNGKIGDYRNPFMQPHYLLLNLAIGGTNGGTPDPDAFPMKYEIDYVRVYQWMDAATE